MLYRGLIRPGHTAVAGHKLEACGRAVTGRGTGMRSLRFLRASCAAAVIACTFSGCMTGMFYTDDPNSSHEPGSDGWWAEKAQLPVGARQVYKKGKAWPPRPRPTGEKQQFSHIFHAAHYWPYPYVCQDREYVRSVYHQQMANGWAAQTTLYSYHFNQETNQLSHPGRAHLSWILTEVPEQFRNIYLQKVYEDHINQQRFESVQQALAAMSLGGPVPPVQWRVGSPQGRAASEVQMIQTLDLQNIASPVLGGGTGGGAGGTGGAGGAGGAGAGGTP